MNCIVPFNKKIKFDTTISEIVSISLEHEITINENSLLGNFIISGEYKALDVSVNVEPFNYTLPFDVSLPDKINLESLSFEINDFTYNIENSNTLNVDIEFSVNADDVIISDTKELNIKDELDNSERNDIEEEKKDVIDFASSKEESFVTYRIHILKEGDTIDSLCKEYNVSDLDIANYNDLSKIVPGDKIIIPEDE